MLLDSGFCLNDGEIRNAVIPAKAGIHREVKNNVIQGNYIHPL
jgi:hypothetical protein